MIDDSSNNEPGNDSSVSDNSSGGKSASNKSDHNESVKKPVYKPLAKLTLATQIALGLLAFIAIVSIAGVLAVYVLSAAGAGNFAKSIIPILAVFDQSHTLVYIVMVILFIAWTRRAYRNVITFNVVGMTHAEWLCIFGWIIPVASLYIPVSMIVEIWKASNPEILDEAAWKLSRDSKLIVSWWICFIAFGVANLVQLSPLARKYASPEVIAFFNSLPVFTLMSLWFIAVCVMAILVLQSVTKRQERKRELVAFAK